MNAIEATTAVPQSETPEAIEESQKRVSVPSRNARLRYGLLIVAAVLLGWFLFTLQSSTHEVEATLDKIHADMVSPSE